MADNFPPPPTLPCKIGIFAAIGIFPKAYPRQSLPRMADQRESDSSNGGISTCRTLICQGPAHHVKRLLQPDRPVFAQGIAEPAPTGPTCPRNESGGRFLTFGFAPGRFNLASLALPKEA